MNLKLSDSGALQFAFNCLAFRRLVRKLRALDFSGWLDCVVWHLIYSHQLVEPISHLS